MEAIIQRHQKRLGNLSIKELEGILELNGIISIEHRFHKPKTYTTAYLYAYFLGIRSRAKKKKKRIKRT